MQTDQKLPKRHYWQFSHRITKFCSFLTYFKEWKINLTFYIYLVAVHRESVCLSTDYSSSLAYSNLGEVVVCFITRLIESPWFVFKGSHLNNIYRCSSRPLVHFSRFLISTAFERSPKIFRGIQRCTFINLPTIWSLKKNTKYNKTYYFRK